MSYLKEIKDFVQTLSIALANSLEIQISILDETLEQIGGTGPYKASVGTSTNKYGLMHKAMLTRELYYVENPREDKKCYGCTMKERCIETASVGYPIIMNDEVIGAIGLNCFSNEERKRLLEKKEFLLKFLESMSELIAAKVKENISIQKIKEQNIQFKEILDFVTDGIIILDKKGKIKNINKNAEKIFNTEIKKVAGLHINELIKKIDINPVISGENSFSYEEYSIKYSKKKYGLFINEIKHSENVGAAILIKDSSDINKVVSMNFINKRVDFEEIVGNSNNLKASKLLALQVASKDADVLINGESGTGKELFARSIHSNSKRSNGPFVSINCAAIPQDLLESELFGYESGSFTGANKTGKIGKFELSNGGTLFLDEIGDMPVYLKEKILRAVENRVVERIEGTKPISIDTRIISATNKILKKMIKLGEFREDLYYRLNIIPIKIPPLRERKEDIVDLFFYFMKKYSEIFNYKIKRLNDDALELLLSYDWPGNVRQLENLVQYICCTNENDIINREILMK